MTYVKKQFEAFFEQIMEENKVVYAESMKVALDSLFLHGMIDSHTHKRLLQFCRPIKIMDCFYDGTALFTFDSAENAYRCESFDVVATLELIMLSDPILSKFEPKTNDLMSILDCLYYENPKHDERFDKDGKALLIMQYDALVLCESEKGQKIQHVNNNDMTNEKTVEKIYEFQGVICDYIPFCYEHRMYLLLKTVDESYLIRDNYEIARYKVRCKNIVAGSSGVYYLDHQGRLFVVNPKTGEEVQLNRAEIEKNNVLEITERGVAVIPEACPFILPTEYTVDGVSNPPELCYQYFYKYVLKEYTTIDVTGRAKDFKNIMRSAKYEIEMFPKQRLHLCLALEELVNEHLYRPKCKRKLQKIQKCIEDNLSIEDMELIQKMLMCIS